MFVTILQIPLSLGLALIHKVSIRHSDEKPPVILIRYACVTSGRWNPKDTLFPLSRRTTSLRTDGRENIVMDVEEHIDNLKEQMENLERAAQETFRRWTRRKNLTILLFLALYLLVEAALWYNREYGPFVPEQVILIAGALPIIFITLLFAHLTVRIVSPFISRFFKDELEPEQRIFFVKIFEIVIYFVALGYLLYSFGVTPASLVLVAGFISGGLAFALRDVVMAFLVWLIILSKKPVRIGDTVRIVESRPLSAKKRWSLDTIIERAI